MPCINFATWAELAAYVMIVRFQGNKIGFCASISRDTRVEKTNGRSMRCGRRASAAAGMLSSLSSTFVPKHYVLTVEFGYGVSLNTIIRM